MTPVYNEIGRETRTNCMDSQYFNRSTYIIFRYINSFWNFNLKFFNRITTKKYSTLKFYKNKNDKHQRYYYYYFIYLICIFLIFFIINLIKLFSTPKYFDTLEIYDVYKSTYLFSNESIILNIHNHSIHHIYIDVGCFNGESIEHFIHFTSNSLIYDIITFEPDPINYHICKQRLTQNKYRNYNIFIIPKAVWIRNEKVFYQTDLGQKSRIDLSETNKNNLPQLDAIDFSSWLSHFIPANNRKLHIKLSMPGTEIKLLQKMIVDGTLSLADQWDIEWTDKSNPYIRPVRYYVQSMFDAFGFDWLYFTRLHDRRKVFKMNGSYTNVTKYREWSKISQVETFLHYVQRPVVIDPPRTTSTKAKFN